MARRKKLKLEDSLNTPAKKAKRVEELAYYFRCCRQWQEEWKRVEGLERNHPLTADEAYQLFQQLRSSIVRSCDSDIKLGHELRGRPDFTKLLNYFTPNLCRVKLRKVEQLDPNRFDNLPAEIRLMIWDAVDTNRVIAVSRCTKQHCDGEKPYPKILAICQESRRLGLQKYKTLRLSRIINRQGNSGATEITLINEIYFDPKCDTIFIDHEISFGRHNTLPYIPHEDFEMIWSLAIKLNLLESFKITEEDFPALKRVTGVRFGNESMLGHLHFGQSPVLELVESKNISLEQTGIRTEHSTGESVAWGIIRTSTWNPDAVGSVLVKNGFFATIGTRVAVTQEEWKKWNAPWAVPMMKDPFVLALVSEDKENNDLSAASEHSTPSPHPAWGLPESPQNSLT